MDTPTLSESRLSCVTVSETALALSAQCINLIQGLFDICNKVMPSMADRHKQKSLCTRQPPLLIFRSEIALNYRLPSCDVILE